MFGFCVLSNYVLPVILSLDRSCGLIRYVYRDPFASKHGIACVEDLGVRGNYRFDSVGLISPSGFCCLYN